MTFEDEISLVGGLAQNSYFALRQNVNKSRRSGIELDLEFLPSAQFTLGFQGTLMRTNVEEFDVGVETLTDVSHVFAPETILAPSLSWRPHSNLTIGLDGTYVAKSYMELSNDPGFEIPSFLVMNGQVEWAATSNIKVGVRVNNILDEQYFTDGAPVDFDFDGTPEGPGYRIQPPRNVFFNAMISF